MSQTPTPPSRACRLLDRASAGFLLLALAAGLLLGGGASATARVVLQSCAMLAFLFTLAAMAAEGGFRWIKSPVWILPAGLLLLPVAQLVAPSGGVGMNPTLNPQATLQWLWWAVAAAMVMYVAAHQVRSLGRVRFLAYGLAALLFGIGLLGGIQIVTATDHAWLGVWPLDQRGTSASIRDAYGVETAIGPTAYRPWNDWQTSELVRDAEPRDQMVWYRPAAQTSGLFGTLRSPAPWVAAVIALLPLLLACAVAADRGQGWHETPRGWFMLAAALLLAAAAAWFGEPIAVLLSIFFGLYFLARSAEHSRRPVLRWMTVCLLAVVAMTASATIWRQGGIAQLLANLTQAWTDNRSLTTLLGAHPWLGAGVGALPDAWPTYRPLSAEVAPRFSAALALAAETGWPAVALVGLGLLFVWRRWNATQQQMHPEARLLVGGMVAGLAGLTILALLAPGPEAPAVLIIAVAFLGCVARGLAGAYRPPERGLAA